MSSIAHEGNPKEDTIIITAGDVLSTATLEVDFLFFGDSGHPLPVPDVPSPDFLNIGVSGIGLEAFGALICGPTETLLTLVANGGVPPYSWSATGPITLSGVSGSVIVVSTNAVVSPPAGTVAFGKLVLENVSSKSANDCTVAGHPANSDSSYFPSIAAAYLEGYDCNGIRISNDLASPFSELGLIGNTYHPHPFNDAVPPEDIIFPGAVDPPIAPNELFEVETNTACPDNAGGLPATGVNVIARCCSGAYLFNDVFKYYPTPTKRWSGAPNVIFTSGDWSMPVGGTGTDGTDYPGQSSDTRKSEMMDFRSQALVDGCCGKVTATVTVVDNAGAQRILVLG